MLEIIELRDGSGYQNRRIFRKNPKGGGRAIAHRYHRTLSARTYLVLGASPITFVLTERMWELICITRSCSGLERFGLKTELKSCAWIKVKESLEIYHQLSLYAQIWAQFIYTYVDNGVLV